MINVWHREVNIKVFREVPARESVPQNGTSYENVAEWNFLGERKTWMHLDDSINKISENIGANWIVYWGDLLSLDGYWESAHICVVGKLDECI